MSSSSSSEIPEGFQEFMDNKSGRKYYYNPETKETKWAAEGLWQKPDWAKKGKDGTLKKTTEGEKVASGENLAKPITNIREHLEKEGKK
eukprot:scaffold1416_cov90-Cylindrotheca_fusiformis.AAC.5